MTRPRKITQAELDRWREADPRADMHIMPLILDRLRVDDYGHIWIDGTGPGYGCIGRVA